MLKGSSVLLRPVAKIRHLAEGSSRLKEILGKSSGDFTAQDSRIVLSHYLNKYPIPKERQYLLRRLHALKDYNGVFLMGRKFLFDADINGPTVQQQSNAGKRIQCGKLREDATMNEIRTFMNSMVHTKKGILLDSFMEEIIAQRSVSNKASLIKIINTMIDRMLTNNLPANEVLIKWAKWMTLLNGHCEFGNYFQEKLYLQKMLFYIRSNPELNDRTTVCTDALLFIMSKKGATMASQMATTMMSLLAKDRNYLLLKQIWEFKVENKLPIRKSDLTNIMNANCHLNEYSLVKKLHETYLEAHDDSKQFDYLLHAHSKSKDWNALQREFDGLFGIGELPNIRQYGITMNALAQVGEVESVEKLFSQLLRREMLPSLAVLQALLKVHFVAGDFKECFIQFENFKKYSIQPVASTYSIMLKVHRNFANIDGALKLLKRMSEENPDCIDESHISILINMCSRTTNHLIAKELFEVMINHYDIKPTGKSVGALMSVYIDSSLPQEALHLFKKYSKEISIKEQLITIYSQAIRGYTKLGDPKHCNKLLNEILVKSIPVDEKFYQSVLLFMVNLSKDYSAAEDTLTKLHSHPSIQLLPSHYEVVMEAYDKISNYKGVFNLYTQMNENKIPLSSKVLLYLIKATFETQLKSKGSLDSAIELVESILDNISNKTLHVTFPNLHPSIVAYPMRVITKYVDPSRALSLLEKYNKLFLPKDNNTVNGSFVIMRSLLILCAEVNQWKDFASIFEKYFDKIEKSRNLLSATVPNLHLSKLTSGLMKYKVLEMEHNNSIELLPTLLERINRLGLELDNSSMNTIVKALCKDKRTIKDAIKMSNDKLIHGYNLIHKYRLLKAIEKEKPLFKEQSWFLQQKETSPNSFIPKLYLKNDTLEILKDSLDSYLNASDDIVKEVQELSNSNKYFMKSYLLTPRLKIERWNLVEDELQVYLNNIRTHKKAISFDEESLNPELQNL